MNRRVFLNAVAAAPAIGLLGAAETAAELPKAKITRVRIYRPPNLNPLFNQSNMVVTVETNIGITGIGEGGREGHAGAVRRHADRPESIPHRGDLAGGVHRLVLSARTREGARARRAGSRACGTSRARRSALPVHELLGGTARDYCECYATGGATPPGTPAGARAQPQGTRARDDGGRLSGVPDGARRGADRRRLRHARGRAPGRAGVPGGPRRRRARTATGASTSTSAST